MELMPVARRTRRGNALLDAATRAKERIDQFTPEAEFVDPSMFDPITRNPQPVSDAITSLANARLEGSQAADQLARDTFNQQIQQLMLSQILGVGGAIGNAATGGNVRTGIDQRVNQALPQALGLQQNLNRQLANTLQQSPIIEGEAAIQVAQQQENARVANAEAQQASRQALSAALIRAEERAVKEGIRIEDAVQQEVGNLQRDRQLGIGETNAAAATSNAVTNRINALKPRAGSGGTGKRPGERGFARTILDDFRGTRARAQRASGQLESVTNPDVENPPTPFELQAGEVTAKELFEQQQIQDDNLIRFTGAIRQAPTDEVADFLAEGLETGDADMLLPVIDELQLRVSRNDPALKAMEAQLNANAQDGQTVSMTDYLNNLERAARSGGLTPRN